MRDDEYIEQSEGGVSARFVLLVLALMVCLGYIGWLVRPTPSPVVSKAPAIPHCWPQAECYAPDCPPPSHCTYTVYGEPYTWTIVSGQTPQGLTITSVSPLPPGTVGVPYQYQQTTKRKGSMMKGSK